MPNYAFSHALNWKSSQCKKLTFDAHQGGMKGASQDCILLATNGDIQAVNAGSPIVYIYLHTVQKVVTGKWKMVGEQLCTTNIVGHNGS